MRFMKLLDVREVLTFLKSSKIARFFGDFQISKLSISDTKIFFFRFVLEITLGVLTKCFEHDSRCAAYFCSARTHQKLGPVILTLVQNLSSGN